MPNRLANETSPYLLQHKDNPIDWWPWCEEAFEKAKSEDKPVFLSVGYSSCHWCHVMAHESFEDEEIAEALNKDFVCIKVDREERPDVDEIYMTAVQMATGHGGWPVTLFMTPNKEPFFAGTYFPKNPRGDYPGFRTLVTSLVSSWEEKRDEIEETANKFGNAIREVVGQTAGPLSPRYSVADIDAWIMGMHEEYDFENGGFGTRPKFPPHATLRFLLDYASKRHTLGGDEMQYGSLTEQAGHMALMTLEEMALGGIHDQVGGGFHRYSTDEEWRLPHFEKMLYDNGMLLGLYADAAKMSGDERLSKFFNRVCDRMVDWLSTEMTSPEGLFYSALDADTEGEEGKYYTWTAAETSEILGERAETFCDVYDVEPEGNFRDEATQELTGANVLTLSQDPEDSFANDLAALKIERDKRERPLLDDKAIAAWNGLMISGLMRAGRNDMAEKCASAWWNLIEDGGLPHSVCQGKRSGPAFLDDLAFLALAFLDLAENDAVWAERAQTLLTQIESEFADEESGGYFFTSTAHEELFGRNKPAIDIVTPSPQAAVAWLQYRLGHLDQARNTMKSLVGWMQRAPRSSETAMRLVLNDFIDNGLESIELESAVSTEVMARLEPEVVQIDEEGFGVVDVLLTIPEGLHINSNEPAANWLSPTRLAVAGATAEALFPDSDSDRFEGEVRIAVRIKPDQPEGEFEISIQYQVCSEQECHMPTEQTLNGRFTSA